MLLPQKTTHDERPPAFNAPRIVVVILAMLIAIHVLRESVSADTNITLLSYTVFSPARYGAGGLEWPGGTAAAAWSFVTYALLHASWVHVLLNGFWLLAFGSPLAKRFGDLRFVIFSAFCAACGAGLYLALHWDEQSVLIGASAAVSGHMAAAARFMFQGDDRADTEATDGRHAARAPRALSLAGMIRHRRAMGFIAIWFLLNLVTGLVGFGDLQNIAWEAHLGGFLGGLLAFSWFDPRPDLHSVS